MYWRCSRRGMLEVDIFLTAFLHGRFAKLQSAEQELFAELLEEDDPALYAWLLGSEEAPDKYKHLCQLIRSNVQQQTVR